MKIKKMTTRFFVLLTAMGCALALFVCPMASIPVKAASLETTIQPRSDDIRYRYIAFGNKLYKRLFNYTTNEWIGDWIYVRDL